MAEDTPLTPAEIVVLASLAPQNQARTAVKVTLASLLVQGVVRIAQEERENLFGTTRTVSRLQVPPTPPPSAAEAGLPPHVESVLDVAREAEGSGGEMTDFVRCARAAYGRTFYDYTRYHVRPALIDRGLLEEHESRLLWVFAFTAVRPTPAGEAEKQRLQAVLEQARTIPDLLADNPAAAAALAVSLGAAVLLAAELAPHLRQLSDAMRAHRPDLDIDDDAAGSLFEAAGFDLSGLDEGAFDAFDAGMDAFDSGFDSAADSGGGDSGGSDSGGSDSGGTD